MISLYCALFWIQGKTKTKGKTSPEELYCALFWIQGKTDAALREMGVIVLCLILDSRQNIAGDGEHTY